jgi:hypothetical protein
MVSIPNHVSTDIGPALISRILRQQGIDRRDFGEGQLESSCALPCPTQTILLHQSLWSHELVLPAWVGWSWPAGPQAGFSFRDSPLYRLLDCQ